MIEKYLNKSYFYKILSQYPESLSTILKNIYAEQYKIN